MPFFVFQDKPLDESIVERLGALSALRAKPIVCWRRRRRIYRRMSDALRGAGIPVYPDVARWVAAASALSTMGTDDPEREKSERTTIQAVAGYDMDKLIITAALTGGIHGKRRIRHCRSSPTKSSARPYAVTKQERPWCIFTRATAEGGAWRTRAYSRR